MYTLYNCTLYSVFAVTFTAYATIENDLHTYFLTNAVKLSLAVRGRAIRKFCRDSILIF